MGLSRAENFVSRRDSSARCRRNSYRLSRYLDLDEGTNRVASTTCWEQAQGCRSMAITQRLTVAEFLALPDEEPALELEPDGVVVQKVSPNGRHSRLQLVVCKRINEFAESHRMAMAFPELRVVFGGAAYVPDVSVFG